MPYQPGSYTQNPLDLAAVAAAAQAETQARQAGANNIASAELARQLADTNARIAAEREAAARAYSFQDEQRRLDEALQRGLLAARLAAEREAQARAAAEAEAEWNRRLQLQQAEWERQLQLQQMENREWYRRRLFEDLLTRRADSRRKREEEAASQVMPWEFGPNATRGMRGEAITRYYRQMQANKGKSNFKDYLTEYLKATTSQERSARALLDDRGGKYANLKSKLRDRIMKKGLYQNPYVLWDEAEKFFRKQVKHRPELADELASIALYDLGFVTDVG